MLNRLFNKYFLAVLSLVLVFSNFSYATQLMFCGMTGEASKCECRHNSPAPAKDLSIGKDKTKCCTHQVSELSNSNQLLTVKTELPKDINAFSPMLLSLAQDLDVQSISFTSLSADKAHIPKSDIPVLTSSLLI
jgi:hypothetical protein